MLLACAGALFGACSQPSAQQERAKPELGAVEAALATNAPETSTHADAARGRELVEHFECNRCHEGTGLASAPLAKNCFSCHEQIMSGKFPVSASALARFRPHVVSARAAPSLTALGARFEERWIIDYLLAPRDLRPALTPSMPRLPIAPAQAAAIAAYLTADRAPAAAPSAALGSERRGRELMDQKGCTTCHAFSGVPPFTPSGASPEGSDAALAAALAPDLRFTRERFRREQLVPFLLNPRALKPDTRMPNFGFSQDEAADIVAYLLGAALALEPVAPFVRLPLLTRHVSFEEANRQVFSRTCHHCHTDAESAGGDGGPGNTGGFGFAPRGVSFSSHASILAGYVDAQGERRSLFEPLADGTPRLVAALLARHDELRSTVRDSVRGMPLGLPPLSAEDIQLVESWVAQGKPL
ncbi:MAG TPA: c-type cytochrome [Polyangiaceae bacterium]